MSKFSKTYPEWQMKHICTDLAQMPRDLFANSQFGYSPAAPPCAHEPQTPSGLHIDRFTQLGFPETFTRQLRIGIPLLLHTLPPAAHIDNYSSVADHLDFVRDTLQQWHTMGVYKEINSRPHITHPLGVVAKDNKLRLIVDASATRLNEHLYAPKFSLPSHAKILPSLTRDTHLAKADLKSGFLQLPIRRCEQTYLGFKHPISKKWCVFLRLPFGLGPAAFLFQTFTEALKLGLRNIMGIEAEVYIDDWLFHHPDKNTAAAHLTLFGQLCDYLGIIVNHKKSEGPARSLNFLGLCMNLPAEQLQLPEDKRLRYRTNILNLIIAAKPTMDHIAQVAGQIVHIASVHRHGWAHTQPLWDVLYNKHTVWTRKTLQRTSFSQSTELTECLKWWAAALATPISRKIWVSASGALLLWDNLTARLMLDHPITITTDASSVGWGASWGTRTLSGVWNAHQTTLSNNWRETKAVLNALNRWTSVEQSRILVLTDNSTTLAVINLRRTTAPGLQHLAERLSDIERSRNIELVALHLPGKLNGLSDALSRQTPALKMAALDIDLQAIPEPACKATIKWGTSESAPTLPRFTPAPLPTADFLIAVATPDIPFLAQHLTRWSQTRSPRQGWILMPTLPSDHLPLPNTTHLSTILAPMPDVPQISFILMRWN